MPNLREEMRQVTRTRVLEEAGRLFEQRGFGATTIRDIAQASEVSVGTVMAVGDKTALLVQVFDGLIMTEHDARAAASSSDAAGDSDCVDRILRLVGPFVTMFTDHQDLARAYASAVVSGTHPSTLFTTLAARLVEEIRVVVDESCPCVGERASAIARAAYFSYVGTLMSWSAHPDADPTALTVSLRSTFTTICITKG
ncbi:TetR/AcrR family transcriptional regulator [Kocuria sp.]|uniref:TetR/AcrR family transcriptional regulator n=1 Tax=Kocuria sp. TaxID=1871328 RepID=UPI0026DFB596|nr:TetR/AcrR family transcriptional regulator [Kocuria sp.]MDO5619643.1 TetR/AcrR family transcriptional regulator [Kocuria sp.]